MSLRTDKKFVGPCTIGVSKLGQRGAKAYDQQEMEALLAFSDLHLHCQFKQRVVWRTWAALARQSAEARTAKQRKFAQRQALIDEQLRQAEAYRATDGSHSLYKVIKIVKRGRPSERVQHCDSQGRFLTAAEKRKALEEHSQDLFGKGEDFQLHGATGVSQFGFVPRRGTEEEALQMCDLLLDQLMELGFKGETPADDAGAESEEKLQRGGMRNRHPSIAVKTVLMDNRFAVGVRCLRPRSPVYLVCVGST
ncbi:unnamed protein product [Symbiodinium microadriaticum]|nr:unnamed protein product [Symbiodinium microadriaticum]